MPPIKPEDIKAEIERLEKALRDCPDSGIRKVIEEWIAGAKKRLASEQKSKLLDWASIEIFLIHLCGWRSAVAFMTGPIFYTKWSVSVTPC
jgi:hypothetical protein